MAPARDRAVWPRGWDGAMPCAWPRRRTCEPVCAPVGLRYRVVARDRPAAVWPARGRAGCGQGACGTAGQPHSCVCRHQPPAQPVHSPGVDMANIPSQRYLGGYRRSVLSREGPRCRRSTAESSPEDPHADDAENEIFTRAWSSSLRVGRLSDEAPLPRTKSWRW